VEEIWDTSMGRGSQDGNSVPGSIELFDTERLFELHDFRIARVTPKGESIEQFPACMHLVLDLVDKYPRDSLATHILD
jgi:hypothetical protein